MDVRMRTAYDRVSLYCFSGTGNTYRVASWMQEEASARGACASVALIDRAEPAAEIRDEPGQLVGVLGPTHGFTAPWALLRFAARLPRVKHAHAFVAATRGGTKLGRLTFPGLEGTAAYLLAFILWLRGYSVRGARGIDTPVNWLAVHPGLTPSACKVLMDWARRQALPFFGRILEGARAFRSLVPLAFGLALAPVSAAYLVMGRFFLAKLFFASSKCNGCGVCADSCPNHAIRMHGRRPFWTFDCESCMRCMAYCPLRAVQAGHSGGVMLYYLGVAGMAGVGLVIALPRTGWLGHVAGWPVWLLCIWAGYRVLHFLAGFRFVNRLLTWTTFTPLYRRSHERLTSLVDLSPKRK